MLRSVADLESLLRLVTRGAAGAREEARRVLDELVARGDLDRAEADEIEAAVRSAVETHRRWLDERVVGPLRSAWRRAGGAAAARAEASGADALAARLDAIEARLARIERALGAPGAAPPAPGAAPGDGR